MVSFMNRLKSKIDSVVASIALGAITAAAVTAATLFSSVAVFIWVQQRYDTVIACVVLAALYSFIAFISFVAAYLRRRKLEREILQASAGSANQRGLSDPDFILSALNGLQSLRARRAISIFTLVTAVAFAFVDFKKAQASSEKPATEA
jgi:hypothetical protein